MTDKELQDFIKHGETGFVEFAMVFGDGWARHAIEIAKELRARLSQCERCGEKNPAEIHTCTPMGVSLTSMKHPILGKAPKYKLSKDSLEPVMLVEEWQGLDTSDFNDFNPYFKAEEAARWAERKLKEKNT